MFQKRFDRETLKYCNGSYRNPWFLVKKKIGANFIYRLINIIMNINRVIIKDVNFSPLLNVFTEKFISI
jgi:hypothetical protein